MTSRVTISMQPEVKKKLHLLAKRRHRSVSKFLNELIDEEAKKEKVQTSKVGLGTYLSNLPLKKFSPANKTDKEIIGDLREEKHLKK